MKNISYLDWRTYFNPQNIYSIGEDLILLDQSRSIVDNNYRMIFYH